MKTFFLDFIYITALIYCLVSQSESWFWSSNKRVKPLKSGECQCYVPRHGIYNGIELNKYRRENNCNLNLYYCAQDNYCGEPKLLLDCSKHFGCYYNSQIIDCRCSDSFRMVYKCGKKLDGQQCFSDLLYYCHENGEAEYVGVCEKESFFKAPKQS